MKEIIKGLKKDLILSTIVLKILWVESKLTVKKNLVQIVIIRCLMSLHYQQIKEISKQNTLREIIILKRSNVYELNKSLKYMK